MFMPQASEEQRRDWGISEDKAEAYLYFHGWTMVEGWEWWHSCFTYDTAPETDWQAILFLMDEWDMGSIANHPRPSMGKKDFFCQPTDR